MTKDEKGIDERSFRFYCDVVAFAHTIPENTKTRHLIGQLVDAAGSIGANREEALGASSRKEFLRYNEISLRSANESVRWLRACMVTRLGAQTQCLRLVDEGRQLARILGRIVLSTKQRNDANLPPEPDT